MDSLFPDREWWLTQFFETDQSGGGGGTGDDGDGEGDDGDGDDGGKTPDEQIADLQEALRKERGDHRKTKRALSTAKKGGKSDDDNAGKPAGGGTGDAKYDKLLSRLEAQDAVIEELRNTNRQGSAERSVRELAAKAGAGNPDRIYRIIKSDLEFDDDGEPENVADLIAEAKRDYPELFKKKGRPADQGGGGGSNKGGKTDWIRAGIDESLGG